MFWGITVGLFSEKTKFSLFGEIFIFVVFLVLGLIFNGY